MKSVAVLLLCAGCALPVEGPTAPRAVGIPVPAAAQEAVVVRHTDGDTLTLRGRGTGPLEGRPTKVRLLLVDTPEEGSCHGAEASLALAQLVPVGDTVRVEADRQVLDRYGRTLLHVWDDTGRSVNEQLLADGHARVLVVRPNVLHLEELRAAEDAARAGGRGVWACDT